MVSSRRPGLPHGPSFLFHLAHDRYSAHPGSLEGLKLGGSWRIIWADLLFVQRRKLRPRDLPGPPSGWRQTHKAQGFRFLAQGSSHSLSGFSSGSAPAPRAGPFSVCCVFCCSVVRFKNGQGSNLDGGNYHVYENGSLEIKMIRKEDQGIYTCVATNILGKAENQVRLEVKGKGEGC